MDFLEKYFSFNKYRYLKKLELQEINSLLYHDEGIDFFTVRFTNFM